MNQRNDDKGKKSRDSDQPHSQQQEPDDSPANVEEEADETTDPLNGWKTVDRRQSHSRGNRGRGSGQRGRERAGSSQSDYGYGRSSSSSSNRGRPQNQSYQSSRGSVAHSQRGASFRGSGQRGGGRAGSSQFDYNQRPTLIGYGHAYGAAHSQRGASSSGGRGPPRGPTRGPPQHPNTGQGTPATDSRAKLKASLKNVEIQTKFLNSLSNESYLKRTGFIDKKWMFARRHFNPDEAQINIYVNFYSMFYDKDYNSWVKVGAVVLPLLVHNEYMDKQIIDSGIFGCFLYTNIINQNPGVRADGPLHYVRILRGEKIPNHGLFTGVFPYYISEDIYKTFVEFSYNKYRTPVQKRFTGRDREYESGIISGEVNEAFNIMIDRTHENTIRDTPEGRNFSAIYVSKYASLVVFFTNKQVKVEKRISKGQLFKDVKDDTIRNELKALKEKEGFHERFLIQGGGVVSIVEYPLYFQFMDDPTATLFEFHKLQKVIPDKDTHPINNLKQRLQGIQFPLIVLNTVSDPEYKQKPRTKMSHFAGYFLEIQNYVTDKNDIKRAILQLPTNFSIDAKELGTKKVKKGKKDNTNPGIEYLREEWNVKKVYEEFTGPVKVDNVFENTYNINHEKCKDNDGSKREAFPDSKDEYLGP